MTEAYDKSGKALNTDALQKQHYNAILKWSALRDANKDPKAIAAAKADADAAGLAYSQAAERDRKANKGGANTGAASSLFGGFGF